MATVIEKRVDTASGAVFLQVKDAIMGNVTLHTVYVSGSSGVADVNAVIDVICAQADADATLIHTRLSDNGLI